MPDIFSKEKRSEIMSRIRSKNTAAELEVFRFLRREGVYFQKHYKKAFGSPDIALPKKRIAVFVDGDFWHGRHGVERLSPEWQEKISKNISRDRKNRWKLRRHGWSVLRVWVSEIERVGTRERALNRVKTFLTEPRSAKYAPETD